MIHEVKLPRETRVYLWQIVRAQMSLLRSAAAFPGTFTQEQLCQQLATKMSRQRAVQLASWLYGRKAPREALEEFAAHDGPTEKMALVGKMRRDVVRLYSRDGNETLECRFPVATKTNPLQSYMKGAHDFLVYFYNGLDDGLSSALFPKNPCQFSRYGREQFFTAFERENPGQYVCAMCDEHRYMTITRGKHSSDIEHYFPRAIYPHFSVHPYNLIPICGPCNTAHLDRDPLQKSDGNRRTLGEIFLPYRAESIAKQGVVRLVWQSTDPPEKRPNFQIQPRQDNEDTIQAKLQAFSEIYNIPGRWQDRIHQIGEQLWRYIRHYVRVEMDQDEEIDVLLLKGELERLLSYLFEDLGKGPWTYGLIWYLGSIIIEEIEAQIDQPTRTEIVPVVDTIRDLLKERNDPVATHTTRARDALAVARKIYNPKPHAL